MGVWNMILPIDELIQEYKMKVSGCIHIGGHDGGEVEKYYNVGIPKCILFEPQGHNFQTCQRIASNRNYEAFNLALGSKEGSIEMYCETNNSGQSSSCLPPKKHMIQYPEIVFDRRENVYMTTLDNFLSNREDRLEYNLINIDVQGYELEVFKGAEETLNNIDYVYSEVNRAELYEKCAMVEELDEFLAKYNFKRVVTEWIGIPRDEEMGLGMEGTWGDALYIKEDCDVDI